MKGKTVFITGGGSGIGRQMALRFGKLGCKVAIADLNEAGAKKVAKEVEDAGGIAKAYSCDVSKNDVVKKVAEQVKKDFGVVHTLVNNAGIVSGTTLLNTDEKKIRLTMDVNVHALFWTTKAFLPDMIEKKEGHVVTIASSAGICGISKMVDYCTSKHAAVGFDQSLRLELKAINADFVKTTCVQPFYINTGMFDGVTTRFPILLPILDENYVADKIVYAVQTNQEVLTMPKFIWMCHLARFLLPPKGFDWCFEFLGMNKSMESFIGRNKKE